MKIDWRIKQFIQKILSILPIGEEINFVFQQKMDNILSKDYTGRIPYAIDHFGLLRDQNFDFNNTQVIEIGTGWVPNDALFLYFLGAKNIITVDHLPHLRLNLVIKVLNAIKKQFPKISESLKIPINELKKREKKIVENSSLNDLLNSMHISYFAPYDFNDIKITPGSIDLIHSFAVFEHVPYPDIIKILNKSKEFLRPGGYILHTIGLHDHNIVSDPTLPPMDFLRYGIKYWEFFQNKLSYVNRLRGVHFIGLFKKLGFKIIKTKPIIDPNSLESLKKIKIAPEFQRLSNEDLATSLITILAKKIK